MAARSLVRRDGILHFNTIIPATSICATGGGTGWEMAVEAFNGGSPLKAMFHFTEDSDIDDAVNLWAVTKGPDDTSDTPDTVGYAGRMLEADQGMPAGPSIIGDMRYTPTVSTEEDLNIETTKLRENPVSAEFLEGGRYSWQRLPPPRPTPPAGPARNTDMANTADGPLAWPCQHSSFKQQIISS